MPTIELWLFTVTDPLTGKRRRTTYRLTIEEARARYRDPEPVPYSLEVRQVNERAAGHGQMLGAKATHENQNPAETGPMSRLGAPVDRDYSRP